MENFERSISFEHVYFAYEGRDHLFKDLNIKFAKGKVTAIVGASGEGKTTIVNLILGLLEPTAGKITVDGITLQEIRRDTWLSRIGFVGQDSFTYHASFNENILFGRTGKPQEAIIEAAKLANAHEFISVLPMGYDTIIGDRGTTISGGQQQRLSIARAVLDNPEILILDEATSSLDTISERLVKTAIDSASKGRTVIVIAHRLSSIRDADEIIVLEGGSVVEEGDHETLLNLDGHYSRLTAAGV